MWWKGSERRRRLTAHKRERAASAMAAGNLSWKTSSLTFLANPPAMAQFQVLDSFCVSGLHGLQFKFVREESMEILGVGVDSAAGSRFAMEHRIAAGHAHFHARDG